MIRTTETITHEGRNFLKIDLGSYEDPDGFQLRHYRVDEEDGTEGGGTLPLTRAEAEAIAAFINAHPAPEATE